MSIAEKSKYSNQGWNRRQSDLAIINEHNSQGFQEWDENQTDFSVEKLKQTPRYNEVNNTNEDIKRKPSDFHNISTHSITGVNKNEDNPFTNNQSQGYQIEDFSNTMNNKSKNQSYDINPYSSTISALKSHIVPNPNTNNIEELKSTSPITNKLLDVVSRNDEAVQRNSSTFLTRSPGKKGSLVNKINRTSENQNLRYSPVKHASLRMSQSQEKLFERLHKGEHKDDLHLEKILDEKKNEHEHDTSCSSIPEYILKKHVYYGGKVDRVNSYNKFVEYWRATPILKMGNEFEDQENKKKLNKKGISLSKRQEELYEENKKMPAEQKVYLTKIKNIRKPLGHIKRF